MKPARKTLLCSLLLLLQTCVALAQPIQSVAVPNALATIEGNSSTSDPFTSTSFRFQQVFDASQFAFLPGYAVITGIGFRVDVASTMGAAFFFAGSTIKLSTTTRAPDGLSSVFSDNVGADADTIFNGVIGLGSDYQAGANPQPFNPNNIGTTTPFYYFPQHGNLLLDIRVVGGQVLFPGSLDSQNAVGDSVSRVFAASNLAASGTADTLGLVAQFQFVAIPEPSTSALAILGAGMTMLFLRRRSDGPLRSGCKRVPQAGAMSLGRCITTLWALSKTSLT